MKMVKVMRSTCFMLGAGLLWASCSSEKGSSDTNDSAAVQKTEVADEGVIVDDQKKEVIITLDMENGFTEKQKEVLKKYNAPPADWLSAGDTVPMYDTTSSQSIGRIIIKPKFGTYK